MEPGHPVTCKWMRTVTKAPSSLWPELQNSIIRTSDQVQTCPGHPNTVTNRFDSFKLHVAELSRAFFIKFMTVFWFWHIWVTFVPNKLNLIQQLVENLSVVHFVIKFLVVKAWGFFFITTLWDQNKDPTCSLNQEQKCTPGYICWERPTKRNTVCTVCKSTVRV